MGNKPIVHAPIATGSTEPRDIRDRFADFVNLKDFGAAGDGVTNDSSAWAAWNTALQNGGMPYIPSGDYLLGTRLVHVPSGHIRPNVNVDSSEYSNSDLVLEAFGCPVYVDSTNGNDDNDGLTPETPVASFEKALLIASTASQSYLGENAGFRQIIVSGGSYTDNIQFVNTDCIVVLKGDVSLNGSISVSHSIVKIAQDSYEEDYVLNIESSSENAISVVTNGYLYTNIDINIEYKNNVNCIIISDTSEFISNKKIAIEKNYATAGGIGVFINADAQFACAGFINIQKSSNAGSFEHGIHCTFKSLCRFYDGVEVLQNVAKIALAVTNCGRCFIRSSNNNITLSNNGTANASVAVLSGGYLSIKSYKDVTFSQSTFAQLQIEDFSNVVISGYDASNTVSFVGNTNYEIVVTRNSYLQIGNIKIHLYGTPSFASILMTDNSLFHRVSNAYPVTGTIIGKKFHLLRQSVLNVDGGGANLFPGTTNGYVDSTSFYG